MSSILHTAAKLFFGLILFVGLPLLVWGPGDISGFLENPARLVYVILTALTQVIVVIALPSVGQNRFEGQETVARQKVALVLLQITSLAVVILAPYSDRHGLGTIAGALSIRFTGLGLYLFGFVLMELAEATLGKNFTVQVAVREGHQLITSGVFRYLRHPRYLGILIFTTGISLVFRSWLSLVVVGVLLVVLLWRIHDEEALMHRHFGQHWEIYVRKSWRLLPFVY